MGEMGLVLCWGLWLMGPFDPCCPLETGDGARRNGNEDYEPRLSYLLTTQTASCLHSYALLAFICAGCVVGRRHGFVLVDQGVAYTRRVP